MENSLTSREFETGNLDKMGQTHGAGYHTGKAKWAAAVGLVGRYLPRIYEKKEEGPK